MGGATSLGEMLRQRATDDPRRVAVIADGRELTYADLVDLFPQFDDEVAIVAVTSPTRGGLAVGVVTVAATAAAVPIDGALSDEQRAALLTRVGSPVILDASDLVAGDVRPTARSLDDAAFIVTTSGSTSVPKLVPNTHRNLWASAEAARRAHHLGPDDRTLALGSMAHVLGLRAVTDALWCGGAVVVPSALTAECVAEALRDHEPTCVVASPPLLSLLADAIESLAPHDRRAATAALRFCRSGAAALRPALTARLHRVVGAPVLHGYGMSEAGKIACVALDEPAPAGSVGRPLGVEVRFDSGEILVRGDCVAPGYVDEAHSSASSFADGWFRTGDVGRIDEEGYLFLLGRRDEVVSRGGELMSLTALETALEEHPGVQTALAAAVEHPTLGIDVVLGYVPSTTSTPTASELRAFVGARVGVSHAPTRIVLLDELPLSATGKASRAGLADFVRRSSDQRSKLDGTEVELAALWCQVLALDIAIRRGDDFFALGASSLQLVELCLTIERAFGCDVTPADLIDHPRLDDMARLVRRGRLTERPLLVTVRAGDPDLLATYIVTGRGGTLAQAQQFVFQMARGRAVYGFEAPGMYDGERPVKRVTDLARLYVDELVAHADGREVALLGMSFGAMVVQEMAAQLERRGHAARVVVMLDCLAPGIAPERRPLWLRRIARTVRHPSRRLWDRRGLSQRIARVADAARRAGVKHHPTPVRTPTIMFTSEMHRARTNDPLLGWTPYLEGPVTRRDFPGRHLRLTRALAPTTAPALDRLLDAYERAGSATR